MTDAARTARLMLFLILVVANLPFTLPAPLPAAPLPLVRVELETAPIWRLELIPGIGPSRARRIVAAREKTGDGLGPLLERALGPRLAARIRASTLIELHEGAR